MSKKTAKVSAYMAYWDTLGFEWIVNVTDYEKQRFWAVLKGNTKVDLPIPRYAILRSQANPQRFPEIWAFESELPLKELLEKYCDKFQSVSVKMPFKLLHSIYLYTNYRTTFIPYFVHPILYLY